MPQTQEVFQTVQQLIVERFGLTEDKVTNEMTFEDLGADSIDVFELIMELEDTFSVQFEDSRIEALKNVGDVVTYIDQLTP
jgi:acyl carrier protein